MRFKKWMAVICVAGILLSACGSGSPNDGNGARVSSGSPNDGNGAHVSSGSPNSSSVQSASTGAPGAAMDETVLEGDVTDFSELPVLTMAYLTSGVGSADEALIEQELNKITGVKIGAAVDLMPVAFAEIATTINMMMSSGEKLDIIPVWQSYYPNYIAGGQLTAMDDLLDQYGQGIREVMDGYLEAGQSGGTQYAIPVYKSYALGTGLWYRSDIAEQLGLDIPEKMSLRQLTDVLKKVKEETDLIPYVPNVSGAQSYQGLFDNLGDTLGVFTDLENCTSVENLFESDQYKEFLDVMKVWYDEGLIYQDCVSSTEQGTNLIATGSAFATMDNYKPGDEATFSNKVGGYAMSYVETRAPMLTTNLVQVIQVGIPYSCKMPDKAMAFINLMYTDPDVMNLLNWGVEGVHYKVLEDGSIDYADGVTAENTGWQTELNWQFGNQSIAHIWHGQGLDLWERIRAFNDNAVKSQAFGFVWDSADYKTQIAACNNVLSQYRTSLEFGTVDIDSHLAEFNSALKSAGLDEIIAGKQQQYDAWKNSVK